MLETRRLRLHHWEDRHRAPFAAMHADPEVMADFGGPISRAESELKFHRYRAAERDHGVSRWAVESRDGAFLGYAGVMPRMDETHPLGAHFEVGWRFTRGAWGNGYATESANAALAHAAREARLADILSYTAPDNLRSQAVMARLGLVRRPSLDFVLPVHRCGAWHGLVWAVPQSRLPTSTMSKSTSFR